ncbi:hypothetical protein JCGZ_16502 [Jatropha curcas]|uniref:Senescence regulator n=1 Tax=Jatropha curcas TaxID=180498 RepID=A0A067K226_JATCU|nr:uncharacterized protein LOC105642215 [Jatropha curcas]KDP29113.1 hypothetical protein JCGZ_16502 [Jatropha curcas]
MASKKIFQAKRTVNNYIFVNPETDINQVISSDHNLFEFDESDIWSNNSSSVSQFESKKILPTSRQSKKGGGRNSLGRLPVSCSSSVPVNIPDWSKIYKEDQYTRHNKDQDDLDQESDHYGDDRDDDDRDGRVPPHEYLARKRGASFSVHEGIGRTLKGRDLRQVRNAIWKKVGFED